MSAELYLFTAGFGVLRLIRKRRRNGVDKSGQKK